MIVWAEADKYFIALHYLKSVDNKSVQLIMSSYCLILPFNTALVCSFRSQQAMTERLHNTIMKALQFAEVYECDTEISL